MQKNSEPSRTTTSCELLEQRIHCQRAAGLRIAESPPVDLIDTGTAEAPSMQLTRRSFGYRSATTTGATGRFTICYIRDGFRSVGRGSARSFDGKAYKCTESGKNEGC